MTSEITADSSIADVYAANLATPSDSDLAQWVTLTPMTGATATTKVGLFGKDLINFYSDCAIVGDDVCKPADYHSYTGWAIGIEWTWASTPATGAYTGVCFAGDKNCLKVLTTADSDNMLSVWTSADAIAANKPDTAPDSYCTTAAGGFD